MTNFDDPELKAYFENYRKQREEALSKPNQYSFTREVNDDGEDQLVASPSNDQTHPMYIITHHIDGQWYAIEDSGNSDVVGELQPTAIKAFYNVRKRAIESEAWATQMLKDMDAGKVEFTHEEPSEEERRDGSLGTTSWKYRSTQ